VSAQDCTRQIDTTDGGNLLCREVSAAERRARIAEEERQAGPEGSQERAARERLERERARSLPWKRPPGRRSCRGGAARRRAPPVGG